MNFGLTERVADGVGQTPLGSLPWIDEETDGCQCEPTFREPVGTGVEDRVVLDVDADGRRDVVQWNPDTESYEGLTADGTGDAIAADRIDHEDLHRGFYAYADGGGLRIGFEYVTTADGSIGTEDVELGPGWHLASSNYDVSSHPSRELAADANWVDGFDGGGFAVWNADRTERLHDGTAGIDVDGTSAPIGHDEAYWIEVDDNGSTPVRRVVSPTFSESDGGDE